MEKTDEKRRVFEELLEEYQNFIESEFSYEDGEREAERKAWLNKYDGMKEPLVKDEKVRKAVRAWAEAMGVKTVEYDDYWQSFRRDNSTICFRDNGDYYFEKLENGKTYTITELCGEEEE